MVKASSLYTPSKCSVRAVSLACCGRFRIDSEQSLPLLFVQFNNLLSGYSDTQRHTARRGRREPGAGRLGSFKNKLKGGQLGWWWGQRWWSIGTGRIPEIDGNGFMALLQCWTSGSRSSSKWKVKDPPQWNVPLKLLNFSFWVEGSVKATKQNNPPNNTYDYIYIYIYICM